VEGGKPLYFSDKAFRKWKKVVSELSGVDFKLKDMRLTWGQDYLDKGAPIEAVSRMMGHKTTKTTETYYARLKEKDAIRAIERSWEPNDQSGLIDRKMRPELSTVEGILERPGRDSDPSRKLDRLA